MDGSNKVAFQAVGNVSADVARDADIIIEVEFEREAALDGQFNGFVGGNGSGEEGKGSNQFLYKAWSSSSSELVELRQITDIYISPRLIHTQI